MKYPSLHDLKLYTDRLENNDNSAVKTVSEYVAQTLSTWSGGCYYMGGQIRMFPCDPISETSFEKAKTATANKFKTYGGPCNSAEAGSMAKSVIDLDNMHKLLNMYMEDQTHSSIIVTLETE
jgi:hypothetical protein